MLEEYRRYCEDMLPQVSRTFALGINVLRDPLMIQVGVSYLICRICDSVEDTNSVPTTTRQNLLNTMAQKLCSHDRDIVLAEIKKIFSLEKFSGAEYDLLQNIYQVMEVYDTFPEHIQKYIHQCVEEMAEGMAITVSRECNGRLECLINNTDLRQYCYYVAGTVGKLLTKLFCDSRSNITPEIRREMEQLEIGFALGLQMTNILKGIYEDQHRGVIYLPKTILDKHLLQFDTIVTDSRRKNAGEMLLEMITFVRHYMMQAVQYTLLIPTTETDIRMFCALPVLFALRTLKLASLHPESVVLGEPLKIKRNEVKELHLEAEKRIGDNVRLQELFDKESKF